MDGNWIAKDKYADRKVMWKVRKWRNHNFTVDRRLSNQELKSKLICDPFNLNDLSVGVFQENAFDDD